MSVIGKTHPDYDAMVDLWSKYRLTYNGGREFIDYYLEMYSVREDTTEFYNRKKISYCPAHAKAAVNDIKNAIFQRTVDISRRDGPQTFLDACNGSDTKGVDNQGNTMNSFIGRLLLPELLTMKKVGVWVDKPDIMPQTRLDNQNVRPYIYYYVAEDILNWSYDNDELITILLRDHTYIYDENGLATAQVERYRLAQKVQGGIKVSFFNTDGAQIDRDGNTTEESYILALSEIPFVIFEITDSLLTDAADYQIALLNIASSDLHYILKANFPFYTEQYDPNFELDHLLRTNGEGATAAEGQEANTKEAKVGITRGRRYPKGTERPSFINPSSEPMTASMNKQKDLQDEIRRLVNLNVSNIEPRKQSADSKAFDERGLESGLSYIGLELEYGERRIAYFWAEYEGTEPSTIKYPDVYSIKSDEERQKEAESLEKSANMFPSMTYRKVIAKESATIRIGHKISADTLDTIHAEIDGSDIIVFDAELMHKDIEAGLLSPETASEDIRLYPEEEYIEASKAHAERLARIAIAQSEGAAAARGIGDASTASGAAEKKVSRDTTQDGVVTDKTRGEGNE